MTTLTKDQIQYLRSLVRMDRHKRDKELSNQAKIAKLPEGLIQRIQAKVDFADQALATLGEMLAEVKNGQ